MGDILQENISVADKSTVDISVADTQERDFPLITETIAKSLQWNLKF